MIVGGLPGVLVRLTVRANPALTGGADFAGCDQGEFRSFEGRYHQSPSQIDDFYFVDVGDRTFNFDIASSPRIAPADMAELEGMLASVRID